jgi:nicotinate-nucleotide adenylyltransferase
MEADDDLFLILGEDALIDLPNWKDPAALAEYASIAVAPREGFAEPSTLPFDPTLVQRIDMPFVDISATDLRRRARLGQSLRYMVPDAVIDFILEQGLYQD